MLRFLFCIIRILSKLAEHKIEMSFYISAMIHLLKKDAITPFCIY